MLEIKQKGIIGEDYIAKLLGEKGLDVVARNYHSRFGEIDIIAIDIVKEKIIFIEVKNIMSKIETYFSISQIQIRNIITTSKLWLSQNSQYSDYSQEFWGVIIQPNKKSQWLELLEF